MNNKHWEKYKYMIKKISYSIICVIVITVIFQIGCNEKINVPPVLDVSGKWSPDTLYKNGYKIFNLDSLVSDTDDPDSQIQWSVSSGPLLTTLLIDSLAGNFVKIEPLRNQTGNDWINLTAIDHTGAYALETYPISIVEPIFNINLFNILIPGNDTFKYKKIYLVNYENKERLEWIVSTDTTYLRYTLTADSLYLYSGPVPVSTAVYFEFYDPDNHIRFNRSVPVEIQ